RPLGPVWNESRHADRSRIAPCLRPPTECGGLAGPSGNASRHADRSRIAPCLRPPTECGGLAGPATVIPHSRPTVSVEDAERVARVVRSGHLVPGVGSPGLGGRRPGVRGAGRGGLGRVARRPGRLLLLRDQALTTGEGGAVAGAPERVARVRDARDYDEREDLVPRFNFKLT